MQLSFENLPLWMVVTRGSVGLASHAIGLYLMAHVGIVRAPLYAAYCLRIAGRKVVERL